MEMDHRRLNELRQLLDQADDGLVNAVKARMRLVREIALVKEKAHLDVHQPQREADMLARLCAMGDKDLSSEEIRILMETVLSISKNAQTRWRQENVRD